MKLYRVDEKIVTFTALNWTLGIIGMMGVWFTTHNWAAILFTFVAGLHIVARVQDKEDPHGT